MKRLLILAVAALEVFAQAQTTTRKTLSLPSVNGILIPQPTDDLSAVVGMYLSVCGAHCTITLPPRDYFLVSPINIKNAHVTVSGPGATLHGSSSLATMINATGDYFTLSGVDVDTNGSTYGVIVTGKHPRVLQNSFHGTAGLYVLAQGSTGFQGSENTFDGTQNGCASQNNIGVTLSTDFEISDNAVFDTCGFSFETIASHNGVIAHNKIRQHTLTQAATANAGQTAFSFTWPSTEPVRSRVWVEVNGTPRSDGVITSTKGSTTLVRFPTGLHAGDVVTALSWTALENIQINSLSYAITSTGNVVDGSGDAGEDVVSDFHAVTDSAATATQNQTVFTFVPSIVPSQIPAVMVGGRVLAGDEVALSSVSNTYIATLKSAQPQGTVVGLVDIQLNQPASTPADYPSDIVFTGEIVRNTAAVCIAPEIAAPRITIMGGTLMDCGLGVQFGNVLNSAIYTAGAVPMVIQGVTISSQRPVNPMQNAIAVLQTVDDDGTLDKRLKIGGVIYAGKFASHLSIPTGSTHIRQSSIDVDLPTIDYPERPDFDAVWETSVPPGTPYFRFSATNSGVVRDTSIVMGGVASIQVPRGVVFDISPLDSVVFENTITKVFFWAKLASGSPTVSLYSSVAGGSTYPITLHPTDTNWHPYSIYLATGALDNSAPFLRVDGTNGSLNIQHVIFAMSPLNDATRSYSGKSSGTQRTLQGR